MTKKKNIQLLCYSWAKRRRKWRPIYCQIESHDWSFCLEIDMQTESNVIVSRWQLDDSIEQGIWKHSNWDYARESSTTCIDLSVIQLNLSLPADPKLILIDFCVHLIHYIMKQSLVVVNLPKYLRAPALRRCDLTLQHMLCFNNPIKASSTVGYCVISIFSWPIVFRPNLHHSSTIGYMHATNSLVGRKWNNGPNSDVPVTSLVIDERRMLRQTDTWMLCKTRVTRPADQ